MVGKRWNGRKGLPSLKSLTTVADAGSGMPRADVGRGDRHAFDVLMRAEHCWSNLERFRRERRRCIDYTYGKQWNDKVTVGCREMTEEEYIKRQGNVPLKNNLIRKLVNTTKGLFISQNTEPICTARDREEQSVGEVMTTVLQYVRDTNDMRNIDVDMFEEFVISGFAGCRKSYGWRNDRLDCWTTPVIAENFFVDPNMRDSRGWDCTLVGELHDLSFGELLGSFAADGREAERLKEIYAGSHNEAFLNSCAEEFGYPKTGNVSFFLPPNAGVCRVIEVWNKERKPRYHCFDPLKGEYYKIETRDKGVEVDEENARRIEQGLSQGMKEEDIPLIRTEWFVDSYWYYRFYAPTGEVLKEGETPYAHGEHPFVFRFYPFVNAEIHSFVSDVIDVQRYVNRLITLYDFIMRASAKGVLMVPKQCLEGTGMTEEDFADEWSRFNGVIFYTQKPGVGMPTQISTNSTNVGIHELLQLQLGFFDEITGVNGALQGKPGDAGTSGTYYAQQTQNATTSLQGLLQSYSAYRKQCALKDVKLIQQFYDTERVVNISGRGGHAIVFDPRQVKNVEFDLTIGESTSSPVFRQAANDFLMEIWRSGQISLEMLLKNGDFPYADTLLADVQQQQQRMEQQMADQERQA